MTLRFSKRRHHPFLVSWFPPIIGRGDERAGNSQLNLSKENKLEKFSAGYMATGVLGGVHEGSEHSTCMAEYGGAS
jgi:hypothetical protein